MLSYDRKKTKPKSSFRSSAYDKNWNSTVKKRKKNFTELTAIRFQTAVGTEEDNSLQFKQDNTHLQPNKGTSCVPTTKLRKPTDVATEPTDRTKSSVCDVSGAIETRSECLSRVLTFLTPPSDCCNTKLSLQFCSTHNYTLVNRVANPSYRILAVSQSTKKNVSACQQVPSSD